MTKSSFLIDWIEAFEKYHKNKEQVYADSMDTIAFLMTELELDYASHYSQCRFNGSSPSLSDMLASAQPPSCKTDATFLKGHCNGNQFESQPKVGNLMRQIAEHYGQNTTGKVYLGGIAAFPGDPAAWVNGRGDVERVVRDRGWQCSGDVTVAQGEVSRPSKAKKKLRLPDAPDSVKQTLADKFIPST